MSRLQIFLPSIEGKKSISPAENATDKEEGIKRILNMSLKKKKIYEYRIFPSLLVKNTSVTTFEF